MEKIKEFIHLLTTTYLTWTLSAIILLIIIIFLAIVLTVSKARKKAQKSKEIFKHESVESLTPEEIDKISNNTSNPKEAKELLENEVDVARKNSLKTKQNVKAQKQKKAVEKPIESLENAEEKVLTTPPTTEVEQPKKQVKEDNKAKKQAKVEEPKRAYVGKWKIVQEDGNYYARLIASNGSTLLQTENYKSLSSLKNGIETIKKNIELENFAVSIDKNGHYRYKLFNLSNRLIFVSQDFSSKAKCESGIESVKRFSKDAQVIIEEK
jgi:uncharacterized protein YegP (UPF0339 family)